MREDWDTPASNFSLLMDLPPCERALTAAELGLLTNQDAFCFDRRAADPERDGGATEQTGNVLPFRPKAAAAPHSVEGAHR
jgi:hypothetical protein